MSARPILLAALLVFGMPEGALAQAYPTAKPIRIIATAAPGGIVDILARIMADKVGATIGQRIVVENRPGAGGNIGGDVVAKSPPDGYTLMLSNVGTVAVHPWLQKDMPFDSLKDLDPVTNVADAPSIVSVYSKLPVTTLKEFIDYAKQNKGKVNYGSAGIGTMPHLAAERFARLVGIEMTHVPYRGANPATIDLSVGQIQVGFIALGTMRAQVDAGTVRPLAVAAKARLEGAPNVPTFEEAGVNGYEAVNWFGIFSAAGTPAPVKAMLNEHVNRMLDDPAVRQRLREGGMAPIKESVEQFAARVRADHAKWGEVVKVAGIKAD
jgi:tripartite-type tricarboxylate transporter receptor subunit TctC